MSIKKVVLASNNLGKIREIKEMLIDVPIDLISQAELNIPDMEETGLTFIENAIAKARHASRLAGLPALAEGAGAAELPATCAAGLSCAAQAVTVPRARSMASGTTIRRERR